MQAHPRREISIFGKPFQVKARIEVLNAYSAHADYSEMTDYLSFLDPHKVKGVFLVHGEYEAQVEWREKLSEQGFRNIKIPEMKSSWQLS